MVEIDDIKSAYDKFAKAINFKCLGCGKCGCITLSFDKPILLMSEEVKILKEKGKMYGVIPTNNGGHLRITPFKCAFFNKDNKCEIHEYKPLICFLHPFQVFTVGFVFGGGMVFDTKCSWVQKNRNRLDKPSKKILDAYNHLYILVMKYKIKLGKLYLN